MPLPRGTIIATMVADPELSFTGSGAARCSFRVVSTDRRFNKETNEWEDGRKLWINATAWRQLGEHLAESVQKGDEVILVGDFQTDEWERDGQKFHDNVFVVRAAGPSLQFRSLPHGTGKQAERSTKPEGADPWASQDEPPF